MLNDESLALIEAGQGVIDLRYDLGGCRVANRYVPERAVGYPEATIRALYAQHGLESREPVHYGGWCGRAAHLDGQDLVIAARL